MRVPCDQCRRRRVRCNSDGTAPCDKCISAGLRCKHEYVPKRRGPKRGVGKVIAQLKSQDAAELELQERQKHLLALDGDHSQLPVGASPAMASVLSPGSAASLPLR